MISLTEAEIAVTVLITAVACSVAGAIISLKKRPYAVNISSTAAAVGVVLGTYLNPTLPVYVFIPLSLCFAFAGVYLSLRFENTCIFEANRNIFLMPSIFLAIAVLALFIFSTDNHSINILLTGYPAIVSFERAVINNIDFGPIHFYVVLVSLIVNIVLVLFFYKEIKLSLFDKAYAKSILYPTKKINTAIDFAVAFTVVMAFKVTGVIAAAVFFLAPALTARFYSKRISSMIIISVVVCIIACIVGIEVARVQNINLSVSISCVMGIFLLFSTAIAPEKGIIPHLLNIGATKKRVAAELIAVHLFLHENDIQNQNTFSHLHTQISWSKSHTKNILAYMKNNMLISDENNCIMLTDKGRAVALKVIDGADK